MLGCTAKLSLKSNDTVTILYYSYITAWSHADNVNTPHFQYSVTDLEVTHSEA